MTDKIKNFSGRVLNTTLKNYYSNTSGNFAVTWALAALPLMLSISIAVDLLNMNRVQVDLQTAVDNAALTAVMPVQYSNSERQTFAEDVFYDNLAGREKYQPKAVANATRDEVAITASATVPTLLGGIIGHTENNIQVKAKAQLSTSDVVCVLALDPTGDNTLTFEDNAQFNAPACSVQANSTSTKAVMAKSRHDPTAKSFCSTGGSVGDFEPYIRNECSPIEDPYAGLSPIYPGKDCDFEKDVDLIGTNTFETINDTGLDLLDVVPDNTQLNPGSYCKGLSITGANVTFNPGVYYLGGELHFTEYAQLTGDRVTFVMMGKGKKGRVIIEDGAVADLRAPATGATSGVVFWQVGESFGKDNKGKGAKSKKDKNKKKIETSQIRSGASVNIIGAVYLPDQALEISSDRPVASKSPATSLIAGQVHFKGNSNTTVRVNHEDGGIPPQIPRSDAGARLID